MDSRQLSLLRMNLKDFGGPSEEAGMVVADRTAMVVMEDTVVMEDMEVTEDTMVHMENMDGGRVRKVVRAKKIRPLLLLFLLQGWSDSNTQLQCSLLQCNVLVVNLFR